MRSATPVRKPFTNTSARADGFAHDLLALGGMEVDGQALLALHRLRAAGLGRAEELRMGSPVAPSSLITRAPSAAVIVTP